MEDEMDCLVIVTDDGPDPRYIKSQCDITKWRCPDCGKRWGKCHCPPTITGGKLIPPCPLCAAEHLTKRFHEDDTCWRCLCKTCGVPMVVLRRHDARPTGEERYHMLRILDGAALWHFISEDYYIDERQRCIPDHYHAHARQKKRGNDLTHP